MSKNLKKLTAFVMSVIVLATMSLSAMAMPNYTFDTAETDGLMPVKEVLFAEDFNGGTNLGVDNAVWGASSGGKNTLTVISRTSNSDSVNGNLYINNVGSEAYFKAKSDTSFTGEYAVEFKVQKNTNNTAARALYAAGYTDGTNEYRAITIGINSSDKPYYVDSTGTQQLLISNNDAWNAGYNLYSSWSWVENEWYTFKVVINTVTGKYSIYLNGALCAEDVDFIPASGHNWSESGINIPYIFAAEYESGQDFRYDDLRIYTEITDREIIYANDFNSYSTETTWSAGSSNYAGVAGLGLGVFSGKGGTIKATTDGKLVTVYENQKGGAIINGLMADDEVTIDMDFTVAEFADDSYVNGWAVVTGLMGSGTQDGIIFATDKNGNLALGHYNRTISTNSTVAKITFEEPHHLTLHADFNTYKCELYIDGLHVATSGILFDSSNNGNSKYIKNGEGFALGFGYATSAPTTTVTYDNVIIYRDVREEVLSAIPSELAKIFPGESLIMKNVVLPTSIAGYEGYNISWSTDADSNIQVGANGKTATVHQTTINQDIKLTATVSDANGDYSVSRSFEVKVWAGPNTKVTDDGNGTITALGRQAIPGSVLFLAIYDSTGALEDLVVADTIVDNVITAIWDYSNFEAGTYTAKAMLLENRTNIAPLCNATAPITITVE